MRVAVYYANDDVRMEERPRPRIGPGELLLRVRASGICGSDLMEWYRKPRAPLVLGHEVAGDVEAVGEGVERFSPGDRVIATHHVPCGDCLYCRSERESVCETLRKTSFDPGGFAEFLRLTPIHVRLGVLPLPDGVTYDEGSFVEPLACVVLAQRRIGIGPGAAVAVLGSGISGLLHVQLAKADGAGPILATDTSESRLRIAERLGASATISARDDVPQAIRGVNGGRPADFVIVCTSATAAIEQAFRSVDYGGTILLFAPADPGETYPLPLQELWSRNVQIRHSYAGPPADMQRALERIAAGDVDATSMITHRLPLSEAGRGFSLAGAGGEALKIILDPTED